MFNLTATREVVVATGAIQTPAFLERSSIAVVPCSTSPLHARWWSRPAPYRHQRFSNAAASRWSHVQPHRYTRGGGRDRRHTDTSVSRTQQHRGGPMFNLTATREVVVATGAIQ